MSQPVIAIIGPTASGKSAAAMRLARDVAALGRTAEIVAADAFTIYRGMDVATAKPSAADRAEVAHHLLDVLDPSEDATVAWFQPLAQSAIADVQARGHVPILVGGAGLYFRAVVDDLRFPPRDEQVRDRIEALVVADAAAAYARLVDVDPAAADKIDPANVRRITRALEVIELTGEKFSKFADEWESYASIYPALQVYGCQVEPQALRERINLRAEQMVSAGLLDEAAELDAATLSRTARQGIGYGEALAVLAGELAQSELGPEIARRTRQYARRQRAWFRRDPRIHWLDPAEIPEAAVTALRG